MKNLVQPHGALLVLDARDHGVVGASESVRTVFGLSHKDLAGFPLARLATAAKLDTLTKALEGPPAEDREPFEVVTHCRRRLHAVMRTSGEQIVLEFEQADEVAPQTTGLLNRLRRSIARLRDADDLDDLAARASQELRGLTGFDRVIVHTFPPDGHALDSRSLRAPYMHFLPTTTYVPSQVQMHGDASAPDLTCTDLWSPSLDALSNLRALGITASMEISMTHGDRPAGLVFGHHESGDHFVPHDVRVACGLLSEVYSSLVGERQRLDAHSAPRLKRAG